MCKLLGIFASDEKLNFDSQPTKYIVLALMGVEMHECVCVCWLVVCACLCVSKVVEYRRMVVYGMVRVCLCWCCALVSVWVDGLSDFSITNWKRWKRSIVQLQRKTLSKSINWCILGAHTKSIESISHGSVQQSVNRSLPRLHFLSYIFLRFLHYCYSLLECFPPLAVTQMSKYIRPIKMPSRTTKEIIFFFFSSFYFVHRCWLRSRTHCARAMVVKSPQKAIKPNQIENGYYLMILLCWFSVLRKHIQIRITIFDIAFCRKWNIMLNFYFDCGSLCAVLTCLTKKKKKKKWRIFSYRVYGGVWQTNGLSSTGYVTAIRDDVITTINYGGAQRAMFGCYRIEE